MSGKDSSYDGKSSGEIVCPESTVESANLRNYGYERRVENKSSKPIVSRISAGAIAGCESTLDSSIRRSFVKGALATAAAIGIGATVLGGTGIGQRIVPASSASSCCFVNAHCSVIADTGCSNTGTCWRPGYGFGTCGGGGEGISSTRVSCHPNSFGLDFYTGSKKRMSVTLSGCVGIGTCTPGATLDVRGCVFAPLGNISTGFSSIVDVSGLNVGCGAHPGLLFGGTCSGQGISSAAVPCSPNFNGLDLYTANAKRLSITSCGAVGIGTDAPISELCVQGLIRGQGVKSFCTATGGVAVCGDASGCGVGLRGFGGFVGVLGGSGAGPGVWAQSGSPLVGKFKNNGSTGDRTALVQFETGPCCSPINWNAGVAGLCNACKIPDGSFYLGQPAKPRLIVNSGGNVGVGTTSPQTTLQVNGGVSLALSIKTASYSMTTSDFAILANATTAALTVTLPAASNTGMTVFIKKIDASTHAVTVSRTGADTIEGVTKKSLSKKNSSLTLVAGGNGTWYVLSNAT